MKVNIVIVFYKGLDALNLIFATLRRQKHNNFDVVGSEDDDETRIKSFLVRQSGFQLVHAHHPYTGHIQNNAIMASKGVYLVFIDDDCIPHSTFIESHYSLFEQCRARVSD